MFLKKRRIVNKDLLQQIKQKPCIICGHKPSDSAHIKTVGAGGNDVEINVISLCRPHHTEQHKTGIRTFALEHPKVLKHLLSMGWKLDDGKLFHQDA